jgi:2-polyprenyl-6-methoxyphenol hydroxylase-like FAD-dependent oxidoreductase
VALSLARAGWAVTLVEAAPPGAPRPYRGEGLMPSGVAALEAMGLWPPPEGVRHRLLGGWAVVVERRPLFSVEEPLGGDRGCWLVDQESLLACLRGELEREGGARVLEGQAVRGLLWANGGERASAVERRGRVAGVVLADGRELEADLVVGCDGRDSRARRLGGLELTLEPPGEEVLWFRLAGPEVGPLEGWLGGRFLTVVGPGLSFALFQEAGGEALRLGWVAEASVERPRETAGWKEVWAGALPREAEALLGRVPLAAISGPQRFPVRVGWAPRWHRPGLLLLGDAAHPMSPVRAQGLNMALRDALVAVQTLGALAERNSGEGMDIEAIRARVDALLPLIERRRLPEIRMSRERQAEEAALGALLRQRGWLRRTLAATAPWSGWAVRQRWIQRQHRPREGLANALILSD